MENAPVSLETIEQAVTGPLSPYRLVKVWNELSGEERPTQLGYNYVKNGLIPTSLNSTGKKEVSRSDAIEFLVKRLIPVEETQEVETV
jgi:hypothetical protein